GIATGWAALQVPELAQRRMVIGGAMVFAALCLLASGSFAGIAGLLVTIVLIERLSSPLHQSLKRLLIAGSLVVAGFLLALPVIWPVIAGRLEYQFSDGNLLPQTFVYRIWIWRDVFWPEIVQHPLFGTSLEIGPNYRWLFAESHYISLLFRFGVIGLAAHLCWVGLMLAWLYRRVQRGDPFTRMMAVAGMASLIYLSFAAFTNEVFLFTGSIDYLWILFALAANGSLHDRDQTANEHEQEL
ncbi:MAG: O-antigen ligase family protein, partial [Oscillochloris sp.]|nr:O-antigen ligase family protein [Oscillochloris sp.]